MMNEIANPILSAKPIRIMIDMETPSTSKESAILTLGAVQFDLPFGIKAPEFYERASLESNERAGLVIDKGTMEWWDKQDPAMRAEAFGGSLDILELLTKFHAWIRMNFEYASPDLQSIELWSRGADFDCTILQNAYEHVIGTYPFNFRKHMCQRTVQNLLPSGLRNLIPEQKYKHHALEDAKHQAAVMEVYLRNVSWGM